MEFFFLNRSIWKAANSLAEVRGVSKNKISAGNAWRRYYRNEKLDYRYVFSFETKQQDPDLEIYNQIEQLNIRYPLNIFTDPKIYLYRKKF